MKNSKQLLVIEEPNVKIYLCVKGDTDRRETKVNITFHTSINLDIGLLQHQLLFSCASVTSVWLILSYNNWSVILNSELRNISCCDPISLLFKGSLVM